MVWSVVSVIEGQRIVMIEEAHDEQDSEMGAVREAE